MSRLLLVLLLGATPQTDPVQKLEKPSAASPNSSVSLSTVGRCTVAKASAESEEERIARIRREGTVVERAILEYKLEEAAKAKAAAAQKKVEAPKPPQPRKPCDVVARK